MDLLLPWARWHGRQVSPPRNRKRWAVPQRQSSLMPTGRRVHESGGGAAVLVGPVWLWRAFRYTSTITMHGAWEYCI